MVSWKALNVSFNVLNEEFLLGLFVCLMLSFDCKGVFIISQFKQGILLVSNKEGIHTKTKLHNCVK
jgi:hypothetical protein